MQNEIRYYLNVIKEAIAEGAFVPQHLVLAVTDKTGVIHLQTYSEDIEKNIDLILEECDDNMCVIDDPDIVITNIMVV